MSRMIQLFAVIFFSVILFLPVYAQEGKPYIYEKIPDSEFYTYKSTPVEGVIEFSETVSRPLGRYLAEVFIKNNSDRPVDLDGAIYRLIKKDGKIYFLEFAEIETNTGIKGSLIVNPEHVIIVYCRSPIRNDDVDKIQINLKDGKKITFVPYEHLGRYVQFPDKYLKALLSGLMDVFKFRLPGSKK